MVDLFQIFVIRFIITTIFFFFCLGSKYLNWRMINCLVSQTLHTTNFKLDNVNKAIPKPTYVMYVFDIFVISTESN